MHLLLPCEERPPQAEPVEVLLDTIEDADYLARLRLTDTTGVISRLFHVLGHDPLLRRAAMDLLTHQAETAEARLIRGQALAILAASTLVAETFAADLTPEQVTDLTGEMAILPPERCAAPGCGANAVADGLCASDAHAAGVL